MEPVTHILTGACLARTGLNRKAAYATLTMAIAAQFPDIDTLWSLRGPVAAFAHHRGITHTFLGIPFEAAIIVGGVWLLHRWRATRYDRRLADAPPDSEPGYDPKRPGSYDDHERIVRPLTAAPVRWGVLYGFALLALLSHLLLDFTNNYGLRPFFPFDRHWYAGSIVFIFDPVIFLLLVGALTLPWLFGLIGSEVGARRQPFRARAWAVIALTGIVAYWGLRTVEHNRAVEMVMQQAVAVPPQVSSAQTSQTDTGLGANPAAPAPDAPAPRYAGAQRVLANPDPLNPFRWYTVGDYGSFYELDTADTRHLNLSGNGVAQSKAQPTPQIRAAEASDLGRAYLDWSSASLLAQDQPDGAGRVSVTFTDLRFVGDIPFLDRDGRPPLSGEVVLDRQNRVIDESLDGRSAEGTLADPPAAGTAR